MHLLVAPEIEKKIIREKNNICIKKPENCGEPALFYAGDRCRAKSPYEWGSRWMKISFGILFLYSLKILFEWAVKFSMKLKNICGYYKGWNEMFLKIFIWVAVSS